MQITLSPQYRDGAEQMTLTRTGDVLSIDGSDCDLTAPGDCPWLVEAPVQEDGIWHVALIFPIGPRAPHEALFPAQITVTGDGPIALPQFDLPASDPPELEEAYL